MAINFRSNTIIKNLRVGPLSGGGNGGGGDSSEPSYLAVGAYGVNSNTGTAYIYDATNYSATPTRITPSGLSSGHKFAQSIAVTSDQIVISAHGDNADRGAIYVYDASNLSSTPTKLTPSGLDGNDRFSYSLAATSTHIVGGAYLDDDQGSNAGAAYVYDATNLSATPTKLVPSGLGSTDTFGEAVAASSNLIVVGAEGDDDQGNSAGAIYVYDATNLSATPTKLAPSSLVADGQFGNSIAVSSNYIVAGASTDNTNGSLAGAAYVFDATNLSATPTKLLPPDLVAFDRFGNSVAISGDLILVGAYRVNDRGTSSGAVYVYDATNLSATPTKLTPSELEDSDEFGISITAVGTQIVVGAWGDADQGTNAGAVYIYDATNLSASPTKLTASDGDLNHRFGSSVSLG